MMKIALISHTHNMGGAEKMLYNLAVLMKGKLNCLPIVFFPQGENSPFKQLCEENLIAYTETTSYTWHIHLNSHNNVDLAQRMLCEIVEYKRLFIELGIDLVVGNTLTSPVYVLAAKELEIPVVTWIHGVLDTYLLNNAYQAEKRLLFDRLILAASDQIIACSSWVKRYYEDFSLTSINVLPNWTAMPNSIEQIESDDNVSVFICLNTFEENKGIFQLLKAAKILNRQGKSFQVHLYGDGGLDIKRTIEQYIKDNNLDKIVFVKGRTNDVASVYRKCFCLVQPSFLESFGMTVIEAMSYAKPVIATRSGGPDDIVEHEKTGFLVEKGDSEAIAEKMAYLLDNPDMALKMGLKGYERCKNNYSELAVITPISNIINFAINSNANKKENALFHDVLLTLIYDLLRSRDVSNPIVNYTEINNVEILQNPVRNFLSEELCFSGAFKVRKYKIVPGNNSLNVIGVIFADNTFKLSEGKITMSVWEKNKNIGEYSVNIATIAMNQWTYFYFNEISHSGVLTIELNIEYSNQYGEIGVYEEKCNRTFWYKVFNKLGKPLQGNDTLFYVMN